MAKALRKGGLYRRGDVFVDAEGEEVSKATARRAVKSAASDADDDEPAETETTTVESDLPEDFPGRSDLVAAGLSQAQVDELDRDGLIAVKGIGEKTADAILALREG